MVATDQEVSVKPTRRTPVVVGLLSVGVTLLGLLVLLGWLTGDETITRLFPVLVAMQPATALDFVLLGLATLLLHCGWARDRVPKVVALLAVLSVVVVAGTGLVTELAGWSYPITILGDMSQNEGRMSGITAVAHLVIAFSLLATVAGRTLVAHSAGVLALTIGLVGLSGYAFGPSDLYDVGYFQTLALHTALGIALLGMALVSGSGEVGLTKLARSRTLGGRLARTLLPAVLVIPTVLGWVGLWMMRNDFGPGFVMALYATSVALLTGALVWLSGVRLTTADVRRSEAEEAREVADRALAELRVASEELRLANRDLRDFTAAAAHDLRGPLSAVVLGVQMLHAEGDPAHERILERIDAAAVRGMTLIDDLLEFGQVPVEVARLDLAPLVQEIVSGVQESSGRPVRLEAGPWSPVRADARLVRRLLTNLIGNAVKYTQGEGPVDVSVGTVTTPEGRILVHVADRGITIPETERDLVFEIFKRGESGARHATGNGVGLAVCRRIVERHGGEISIVDRDGWSKSFELTLPAADVAPRQEPSIPQGRRRQAWSSSAKARPTASA
jgi:signal transduction histidine kinase